MANVEVKIDWREVSRAVAPVIRAQAEQIRDRAGVRRGYGYSMVEHGFPARSNAPRAHAIVYTGSYRAVVDNAHHNRILKAAGGGL